MSEFPAGEEPFGRDPPDRTGESRRPDPESPFSHTMRPRLARSMSGRRLVYNQWKDGGGRRSDGSHPSLDRYAATADNRHRYGHHHIRIQIMLPHVHGIVAL